MSAFSKVKINGKEVGLYFGMPAMGILNKKASKLFKGTFYDGVTVAWMLFAGYSNNCEIEVIEEELKYKDFYMMVEDQILNGKLADDVTRAVKTFEQSRVVAFNKPAKIQSKEVVVEEAELVEDEKKN